MLDDNSVNDDLDALIGQEEVDPPETSEASADPAPAPPNEKGEEPETPPETPSEPVEPEPAKPLTADEVRSIVSDIRRDEQVANKSQQALTDDIVRAYYPQGLSNTLIDDATGRELKTPQDVVDVSGGNMTMEEAAQWLMNEQYKLDRQVAEIKESARGLAEVNSNFREGAVRVIEKYQAIFDKWPQLQNKIYKNYMKTVKMDSEKDLILSAPDIEEYYEAVMEPYVLAHQFSQKQTPPSSPPPVGIPDAPKQSAEDRMDVSGDGGVEKQVNKDDPDDTLGDLFGNG